MTPAPVSVSTASRSRWLPVALLLSTALGCGGGEATKSGKAAPESSREAAGAGAVPHRDGTDSWPQVDPERPQVAFTERSRPPEPAVNALLEERRAEVHGWMTEVVQERGRAALETLLEEVLAGPGPATDARLAEDFTTTSLRPAGLTQVFDDGAAVVRRAPTLSKERLEADAARGALRTLHGLFRGGADLRAEVEIIASRIPSPGHFENEALIVLSGAKAGERVQVSCTWRLSWLDRGDAAPLLEEVELLAYEEVSMPRPLFGDLTAYAFGAHPFFRSEFLLGVDDYFLKMDQLAGPAFLGSQGLAVGDANHDGVDDVFVAQQSGLPNRLFLHRPDGRGEDVALGTGLGFLDSVRGALFVDLDNDGDQDIAMGLGPNVLVVYNSGAGVFSGPVLLESGEQHNVFSLCAADPDDDGDLDIYACHYVLSNGRVTTLPAPYYDANNGSRNHYWRNEGDRKFEDATEEVGLGVNNTRFSLAGIWEDLDLDGDVDLYVTNDFGLNNLYRNDGGRFVDVAEEAGASDMASGMGATVADYDHDGDMDVYVSNMFMAEGLRITAHTDRFRGGKDPEVHANYHRVARGNTLLRNRGDGTFDDVTLEAGVWRGGWSWGAVFGDFDNDGWSDTYVPNGFVTGWTDDDVDSFHWRSVMGRAPLDDNMTESYVLAWAAMEYMVMQKGASYSGHERNRLYLNTGDGRFADVGAASGADFLDDSRAVGMLDWDDDGRLDMVMKNRTAPRLRLLLNQDTSAGAFLAVELEGVSCNRDAIGARVEVELEGVTLRRTLHAGEGFIAQSSKRLHFGLGGATQVRSLTVHWPGGASDRYEGLAANARYRIVQGAAEPVLIPPRTVAGLAAKTTAPMEKLPGSGVDRVVLVERLPLGPLRVPSFKNEERTVADFTGFPVLFDMWASYGADCRIEQERFKRRRTQLEAAGVQVVLLTIDTPEDYELAEALLDESGLSYLAGYLDQSALLPFEVILSEILGRSSTTPLPTSFLVDERGYLAVVYLGPVRVPQLLSDLAIMQSMPRDDISGEALLGGRWLSPRTRSLSRVVDTFGMLGLRDLGRHFFDFEQSR